jgi:acetyl coenzyme A synthetase (ADP forming)-like protein
MTLDLNAIFEPQSIAVIGASREEGKTGNVVMKNIVDAGYSKPIYPVNPKADEIMGFKAYPSLDNVPGQVDLAVIIVPSKFVPSVMEQCAAKHVKGAIIISGGFAEAGKEGEELQKSVVEIAKRSGIRVVGPNCQGVNNPYANMCASWPLIKERGPIAVISQSGTVGATMECWAKDDNLGISKFVALGNKADVNEIDLIEYFLKDPDSKVITVYVEGVSNGKRFMELSKESLKKKPIVIIKGGRTEAGARAVMSHTRSLAGKDEIFNAAFKQSGTIRVDNLEELYDASKALSYLPLPKGRQTLIVTSSGGSAILATDAAESVGIKLTSPSEAFVQKLSQVLPSRCILKNPLDLTGDADPPRYEIVLREAIKEPYYDALIAIFGDPIPGASEMIVNLQKTTEKPIIVVYLGGGEIEKVERAKMHSLGIPVFSTPERAVKALSCLIRYSDFRKQI